MREVLILEDSHTQRMLMAYPLRQAGMQVLEATNGLEALEILKTHHPDVIISDIVCPVMNGYELCAWLKQNPKTQHIPLIFCTVKTEERDRAWGLQQGASAYICKPFELPELVETVIELILQQGKTFTDLSPAYDWLEIGLMWLEEYENQDWAIAAFSKALQLNPNSQLAQQYRDRALGNLQDTRSCATCQYYFGGKPGGNLLVCAVHPNGPSDPLCRDWESKYR
ncbi:response regulator [Desertifilum sp. FACHB-1129]|nr:response regulator [Desertifilum tharense]MBD2315047.1 response regulator [Desertifilum sp. FACHB-1129]MBD2325185.1 response regulator [Desertifilum sp. FACHB-866]MBD2335267.1 response regulator [Desertifilum sp. FACHB-868]MDA0213581.1 response regulator [Cyanobacteria bacterium FC1]MDI9638007.1 response regulator [Geitlerinema splendidum]